MAGAQTADVVTVERSTRVVVFRDFPLQDGMAPGQLLDVGRDNWYRVLELRPLKRGRVEILVENSHERIG